MGGGCERPCVVGGNEFRLAGLKGTQRSPVIIPGVSLCVCLPFSHHAHTHTHRGACLRTGCNTMMSSLLQLAVRLLREGGGERLGKGEGGIEAREE